MYPFSSTSYILCLNMGVHVAIFPRLTITQNRILRCIIFLKIIWFNNRVFSEAKLMKFSFIHKYFMFLLIFKNQRHYTIFNLTDNVVNNIDNIINLICPCPVFKTTLFKNSIINSGPIFFNSLSLDKKKKFSFQLLLSIYTKRKLRSILSHSSIFNLV